MAAQGATILVARIRARLKRFSKRNTHPPDDLAKAGDKAPKIETFGKKEIKEGNQILSFTPSRDHRMSGHGHGVCSERTGACFKASWFPGIRLRDASRRSAHGVDSEANLKWNGWRARTGWPYAEMTKALGALRK
jgi:hypothetical protein